MAALQDEQVEGNIVGLNLVTGEPMDPIQEGVYDSFRVLRNCIASSSGIASNLLLCDELLKARQMVGKEVTPLKQRLISHRGVNKVLGPEKARASNYYRELSGGSTCMSSIYAATWDDRKHQRLYSRHVRNAPTRKRTIDSNCQ